MEEEKFFWIRIEKQPRQEFLFLTITTIRWGSFEIFPIYDQLVRLVIFIELLSNSDYLWLLSSSPTALPHRLQSHTRVAHWNHKSSGLMVVVVDYKCEKTHISLFHFQWALLLFYYSPVATDTRRRRRRRTWLTTYRGYAVKCQGEAILCNSSCYKWQVGYEENS